MIDTVDKKTFSERYICLRLEDNEMGNGSSDISFATSSKIL